MNEQVLQSGEQQQGGFYSLAPGKKLPIPFWAVVECWDFGLMSKYFENLNGKCQQKIIQRLGFAKPSTLINWLAEINILRNRCAHHSRIWNRASANPISLKGFEIAPYFQILNLDMVVGQIS